MPRMAEYDLEPLRLGPGTRHIRAYDCPPEPCMYYDCKLYRRRFRDGRPPRQCPMPTTCFYIDAQKEWRKQRREKRRMAKLDLFLRKQEGLVGLVQPRIVREAEPASFSWKEYEKEEWS